MPQKKKTTVGISQIGGSKQSKWYTKGQKSQVTEGIPRLVLTQTTQFLGKVSLPSQKMPKRNQKMPRDGPKVDQGGLAQKMPRNGSKFAKKMIKSCPKVAQMEPID